MNPWEQFFLARGSSVAWHPKCGIAAPCRPCSSLQPSPAFPSYPFFPSISFFFFFLSIHLSPSISSCVSFLSSDYFFLLSYYSPPVFSPLLTPLAFLSSSLSLPGWRSRSRNYDFNPPHKSILFPLPAKLLRSLAERAVTLLCFIYLSNRAI